MFDRKALAAFSSQIRVGAGGFDRDSQAQLRQAARAERDRVLREQSQRAGIAPTDLAIADGRRGAPIDAAQRMVIIEYNYMREVVQETLRALIARSPRVSGDYQRGFQMLIGGSQADSIAAIRHDTPEVIIVNTSPYARRLEVGRRSDGKPFVIQVPPRIVEEVAQVAASRFGNMARLAFSYFDLDAGYTRRSSGGRRRDRRAGSPIRYPGIRITAL
jgi:hypothetical protein